MSQNGYNITIFTHAFEIAKGPFEENTDYIHVAYTKHNCEC